MGEQLDRFSNTFELYEQAAANSPELRRKLDEKAKKLVEVAERSTLSLELNMEDWGVIAAGLIMFVKGEKPNQVGLGTTERSLDRLLGELREKGNAVFRAAKEAGDL